MKLWFAINAAILVSGLLFAVGGPLCGVVGFALMGFIGVAWLLGDMM